MDFENIDRLGDYGFCEPIPVSRLREMKCNDVPVAPGVYLVIRLDKAEPRFLEQSTGGLHKGKNPTVLLDELRENWVDNTLVIYIGKGDILKRRLNQYMRYGIGHSSGHWGGRYIWQLSESANLLITWKLTPDENPKNVEQILIHEFKNRYGKLPFANLRN